MAGYYACGAFVEFCKNHSKNKNFGAGVVMTEGFALNHDKTVANLILLCKVQRKKKSHSNPPPPPPKKKRLSERCRKHSSLFYYQFNVSTNCQMSGNQCIPWLDAIFCCIAFGFTLLTGLFEILHVKRPYCKLCLMQFRIMPYLPVPVSQSVQDFHCFPGETTVNSSS